MIGRCGKFYSILVECLERIALKKVEVELALRGSVVLQGDVHCALEGGRDRVGVHGLVPLVGCDLLGLAIAVAVCIGNRHIAEGKELAVELHFIGKVHTGHLIIYGRIIIGTVVTATC